MNKCPNCGYSFKDNDAYCAMCGTKLPQVADDDIDDEKAVETDDTLLNSINQFSRNDDDKKKNEVNFNKSEPKSALSGFILIMLFISLSMSLSLYLVIQRQESKKLEMRFDNMISNPALIPELKEPKTFLELKTNLEANENFLSLYLKHSKDAPDSKEQVFISYLTEMDKLPHITNENVVMDDLNVCSSAKSEYKTRKCADKLTKDLKSVGIIAISEHNTIYLFPDYKFINKKYSKYLSKQMNDYLKLKAKYNTPVRVGLTLQISPKSIADKIYDFEKLYTKISDTYIRDEVLKTIYYDIRTFIFTPSIYATTTQEMKPEFKNAYNYFVSMRKKSQLRPLIMSYLDKMRAYNETNFANDYPYKAFNDSFDDNVEHSVLGDIFVQLRKNLFSSNTQQVFSYVYNIATSSWSKYDKSVALNQSNYIFSSPDSNNNVSIYNNTFSLMQELNIPKYSKLFMSNKSLFLYNQDRLNLSKIVFNGRVFSFQKLNNFDASLAFPGVQVINIDSYQNYNIYIEKHNEKANFIVLSRYSQGFDGYKLTPLKGNVSLGALPNMFSVLSTDDCDISFHFANVNPNETSDANPTYKISIHTIGSSKDSVVQYDEKTASEEKEETHTPIIMPKIIKDKDDISDSKIEKNDLSLPPNQKIEPPTED